MSAFSPTPLDLALYDALTRRPADLPLTGAGCTLAIIDQPLWTDHPAYAANIRNYFCINKAVRPVDAYDKAAQMHGSAVTSLVVDMAPEVGIIYLAVETWHGRQSCLRETADAYRLLQKKVEEGLKIDAISNSLGWVGPGRNRPEEPGTAELDRLVNWFEDRGIAVFNTNTKFAYPCGLQGLASSWHHRTPPWPAMADLAYPSVAFPVDNLMLACRNRTQWDSVKSPYFRCATGGQSWAVPQRAGLFALAREANPSITKEQVDALLVQTARSVAFAPDIHLAVRDIAAFAEKLAPKTPKPQARRVSPPVPAALT